MIEVFDESGNHLGYINPSVSILCNGDIIKINDKTYIVTRWQYDFSGNSSNSVKVR